MYRFFIKVVILFSSIGLVACSGTDKEAKNIVQNPTEGIWQNRDSSPLQFSLEQTYGNNKDIMLPQVFHLEGPVADQDGNIYVIDDQNGILYSFDPDGNLRWKTGKKGKGPGDFQSPMGLVTDGNYLYTANVSGSRIDQFDFKGDLVNSTSLEKLDLTFSSVKGFLSGDLVLASTLWGKAGDKITLLDTTNSLKKVAQFNIALNDIDFGKGLSQGINIHVVDTLIAAGSVQNYTIRFYDRRGNKVKTVKRNFDKLVRPGYYQSSGRRMIRSFGSLGAPVPLSPDYFIVSLSWPTNVKNPDQYLKRFINDNSNVPEIKFKNSLDLYDAGGKLLYSAVDKGTHARIGDISYADENGNIYTKSDTPFPQIRRYHYHINGSE